MKLYGIKFRIQENLIPQVVIFLKLLHFCA